MRPRKKVLLVGPLIDPDTAALRFVLRCTASLAVTHTVSIAEAQELLSETRGQFSLMLIIWPRWGDVPMLEAARAADPLLPIMASVSRTASTGADCTLCRPTTAEVLERVKVLIARKRGPRKGSESAMRCGKPVRTLTDSAA